jgi:hypothetical protein
VYESINTHADGEGGTAVNWLVNKTTESQWRISIGTGGDTPLWFVISDSPISDFAPFTASGVPSVGTATVTYGPTSHSTASGSAGMETDGGSIGLYSEYNDFDDDKELQWAWVSLIKPLSGNDTDDRLLSFETADGVGYYWSQTAESVFNALWTGTTALDLDFTALEDKVHNVMNFSDIAANDSWLTVDGITVDSQINAATLNAIDPVKATLGSRNDAAADFYNGVYAGQFRLDLTGVTADEAFKTGLASAINTAALASNYNAHAIARAVADYNQDGQITGVYYALNELSSGDASDYYLLAYDLQSQTAITQGFYGLVSPSGVTGTVLVPGGGYRGRYGGTYRGRYRGVGRY